jgi:hypothetical protein
MIYGFVVVIWLVSFLLFRDSKFIKYCKACNVVLHRKIKTKKKDWCLLGLNINRKKTKIQRNVGIQGRDIGSVGTEHDGDSWRATVYGAEG